MEALAETFLDMPDGYDSDEEALTHARPVYTQGTRSCIELFKNAMENRVASKRRLVNHDHEAAAPGTNDQQRRWLNRFQAFLKTINVTDGTTPSGEHIYRFIDTIAKIIPSKYRDKPRPSVSTIKVGLKSLVGILVGHYESFSISNHWAVKCDSLFNTLVREGVLIKGTWEKRRRIGFHTVLALGDAFLQSGLEEGCLSWDTHLSKQLSVVLIAACACRAGETARTPLYTGTEYLAFKDIVLSFGSGDQPNDLSMDVTLRAVKGFKNALNEDRYIHIAALQDSKHNSVCPVKLLVIHALRTGAVDSSSWEKLTAQTLRRRDRTVQWKTPDCPVISAIIPGQCSFLDLEKPARTGQIMNTLVNMGRKAKLVVKATTHDVRRGSVKDISHLKDDVRGFATPTVAAAVGHRVSTYMNDVTASYNGGSDVSIWTLRAESGFKDRQAPILADSPFVARNPGKHEVRTYCAAEGWDAEDPHALRNAKRRLVEDQENAWRIASKNADVWADPLPHKKRFTTNIPVMRERSASQINKGLSTPDDARIDPRLLTGTFASSSRVAGDAGIEKSTPSIVRDDEPSNIDDFEEGDVKQVLSQQEMIQAEYLVSVISGTQIDGEVTVQVGEEDLQADLDNVLLEALEDAPIQDQDDRVHVSAENFIRFFAKINVTRNRNAARMTDEVFQQEATRWVSTGNSRDHPTRFLFCCPQKEWGCSFSARVLSKLEIHFISCKISEEQPFMQQELLFQCRKAGCSESFSSVATRGNHEREHDWVRRQCTRGCTDGKWFETKSAWEYHQRVAHDDDWDVNTTCSYPGCPRKAVFATRQAYRDHLKATHKLRAEESKTYISAPTHRGTAFGQRSCPHSDCAGSDIQRPRRDLEAHLRSKRKDGHGLTAEEATNMVDEMLI